LLRREGIEVLHRPPWINEALLRLDFPYRGLETGKDRMRDHLSESIDGNTNLVFRSDSA
jgi:hypothetical protein